MDTIIGLTQEEIDLIVKPKKVRNSLGKSQSRLYDETGISDSTINNYEKFSNPISEKMYQRFKTIPQIKDVPYKPDEITKYKEQMYLKMNRLNYNDAEAVRSEIKRLQNCVEYCFDDDLIAYCSIFIAIYHYMLKEKDECEAIVSSLDKKIFTDLHWRWYSLLMGMIKHDKWEYIEVMDMYSKANELSIKLGIDNKTLIFKMGYCLTEMGYPYQANELLLSLTLEDVSFIFYINDFPYKKFVILNYSKTGKGERALDLLDAIYRNFDWENEDNKHILINMYITYGQVHDNLGNEEKALDYFNLSLNLYAEKNEAWLATTCLKLTVLRSYKPDDILINELEEAREIAKKNNFCFWYEWLNAIYHSLNFDKKASLGHFIHTSIPKISGYGRIELVVKFREWLIDFYAPGSYKEATKQYKEIAKLKKMIFEGEIIS